MPHLIERIADTVRIAFGSFSLLDVDGPSRSPDALDPEKLYSLTDENAIWFVATPNMAIVRSRAGYHHTARITLELWDAEAPAEDGPEAEMRTVEFSSSSGRLRSVSHHGDVGPLLDLRVPGASWLVRGHRIVKPDSFAGDLDAEDIEDEDEDAEGALEGLEEFLFQFWPVNACQP
ncbi:hypothetical protein [Sinosporangium siamense]|uniref:Uncharacterized protein n=2 Tax=Sinosporangium siamense TaxID=1367973 RepID=A0A919VFF7_9ACTN|nr:hypothetical protein [Sinosporangium siamense]GII96079.1 hypothetical protein Ssi02_63100 [Sinosporangium siamense]